MSREVDGNVVEDPDALVRSHTAVRVLPDADSPPAPENGVIRPAPAQVLTRDGTALMLPSAEERADRDRLAQEVGKFEDLPASELERLRLHWFERGSGIVFQNPTDHVFRLAVRFEASSNSECGEMVMRGPIGRRASTAPAARRQACAHDSATVTLFDRHNFVVARAEVRP